MEIWSKNLGPSLGERHLATVDGPGLWEVTGQNAEGKSTLLRAMGLFGEERLGAADAGSYVTDGEVQGWLYMEPARLEFSSPDGGPQLPIRTGSEALQRIEEIPDPIALLISGGSAKQRTVKDKAVRARNRLEQLLIFAPVGASDEMLERLCRCMDERSFCSGLRDDQATAWNLLMAHAGAKVARFQPLPPHRPAQVRLQVEDARGKGAGSVLDDQQVLHKLLNRLATAAGHAAAQQKLVIATAAGGIQASVEAAARRLQERSNPSFRRRIENWSGDLGKLGDDLETARAAAARTRVSYEHKTAEQKRRDELSTSIGDRPDDAAARARLDDALQAFEVAREGHESQVVDVRSLKAQVDAQRANLSKATGHLGNSWATWQGSCDRVNGALGLPAAPFDVKVPTWPADCSTGDPPGDRLTLPLQDATEALKYAVTEASAVQKLHSEMVEAHEALKILAGAVKAELQRAETERDDAEGALKLATKQITAWDATAALISEAVPGPTGEDVEDGDDAVERAQGEIAMGEASAALLRAVAEHQAEDEILTWLLDLELDYREAAADSWKHLGDIVTEHLALPWLRVQGMDLILIYDAETKRLATDFPRTASRFPPTGIRTEERKLDDPKRVSTAELHEAMLKLMLDRRRTAVKSAGRSPIIILPWSCESPSAIASLDDERKRRFAADVEDAGLVIFAERPSRVGEPDEVRMVKVEALR